ncbi:hypothetical protein PFNF135_01308 [Plasmodium falciparum NF135/5.C10]|uniref:Uncharacterized protein n=1 Tax=Plasmodium falciparum NF135/5.C10 TaxID=1036726 RepID=W4IL12_PLAFA|nr:hypothetical protein PFNF135_01308 [Plasmodium falciparum NF135/5.C10]
MIKEKLLKFLNYYYFFKKYYIYHILFLYIFFLRITYTYAEITISQFYTFLLSKYENVENSRREDNFFYYFTHFFNFNSRCDDKFLNTKLFVVVYLPICLKCFYTLFFDYVAYYIYIRYYFNKINNDFRNFFFSSLSYENIQVSNNSVCKNALHIVKKVRSNSINKLKKEKKGIKKKNEVMNNYMRNRFSKMSFEEYKKYCSFLKRTHKKKKKKKKGNSFFYINGKKKLSSFGTTDYRKSVYNKYKNKKRRKYNDNTFNNITYDTSSNEYNNNFIRKNVSLDEVKMKIMKYDEEFIKNNRLLCEKDQGHDGGNGLFNNLFKNRKHIFFRRKNKNKIMDKNNNNNKYNNNNNNNNMKNVNNWDEVIFSKFLKEKFKMIKKKNDINSINEDTNRNEYFLENNINKERIKNNSMNSWGILNYLFFKKSNDSNISYEALPDDTSNDNQHYNKIHKNVNNIYNTTFNQCYNKEYNNSSVLCSKDYDEIYKNNKRSDDEKEKLLNFRLDKNNGKNQKKSENTDNMVNVKGVSTKNYFINFYNNLQNDNFLMNEENEFDVYTKGDISKEQINVHNKSYNEDINEQKKMSKKGKKSKKGKTSVLDTNVDIDGNGYNDGTIILKENTDDNNNDNNDDGNNSDNNNDNNNNNNNNNISYDYNNYGNRNNFDMSYLKSNIVNNYIKGEKKNYLKKKNNPDNINECNNYDYNEINEDLNESQKMCYRSLRGSLHMEYIFKDSYELLDNNEYNEYYYYNKFKSFYYEIDEENQTCSNIKEIISNKINAEFYHLKLNILILSCIIIQIFNSFILILISNNFILKRERIFFFCFLYSLLESVTDVISDNIFFLCGKFTNIYKKEFSINSIYIIQVISKMVLSVSTIFIYFIYHIFVILFNEVNIMIINTLIKALSIFVLSFIFLKNKDNIFSYYYNDKYVHLNNFFQKRNGEVGKLDGRRLAALMRRELNDPMVKRGLYVSRGNNIISGFQQNEEVKSEMLNSDNNKVGAQKDVEQNNRCDVNLNVNYSNGNNNNNKKIIPSNTSDLSFKDIYKYDAYIKDAYVKNEKLNYSAMSKGDINNTYIKDEDLLNSTFGKGEYNKKIRKNGYNIFFMDKLKCVLEVLNIFKFISRIKSYLCKRNRMPYDFNYTLLNVKSVKYDESKIYDNGKYGKGKKKRKKSKLYKKYGKNENLNFEIKIPTIKNIKDLFCVNNKFDWSCSIPNNDMIKNCKMPLLNDNINMNNTWINNNNNNNIKKKNNINKKKKIIINYPLKLLLNNLNFSNIFYICLLLIIPTFERIFLNYKIKNITLDLHSYCYLNIVNYITDLIGLYIYISYFNEESYTSSIFLSSLINIFLLSLRFLFLYKKFNQLGLLFLETILKSLHKTFFYMPIFILVTKVYIKNINNLMCSFYSSILDVSSFASYYFEYLILSFYNIDDSKNIFIFVYLTFLILHLLSLIVISKLKK